MGRSVRFTCTSDGQAALIQAAVDRYRRNLKGAGFDLRNFAAPGAEGPGFGYDAVRTAADAMHAGSTSYLAPRMADGLLAALRFTASQTSEPAQRAELGELITRMAAAIA